MRFASLVGVPAHADLRLELPIADGDRARATALFRDAAIDAWHPVIALSVVSSVDRKRWAAERYAQLADRLIDECGAQLVLTNGPSELDQVRAVVDRMQRRPAVWNYGPTTLGWLASLYERCDLWTISVHAERSHLVLPGCLGPNPSGGTPFTRGVPGSTAVQINSCARARPRTP